MFIKSFSTSDNGTVEIFIPEHHKNIAVICSGGKDSTLLLYFLCEYLMETKRTNVNIHVCHYYDIIFPKRMSAFESIISRFEKQYPLLTFKKNIIELVSNNKYKTDVKAIAYLKNHQEVNSFFWGFSALPPKELLKQFREIKPGYNDNFYNVMFNRREMTKTPDQLFDHNGKITDNVDNCGLMLKSPLLRVDSYFTYEYYKNNSFLTELFPLTSSCVYAGIENNSCKSCWWCLEKKVIFGGYDGQSMQ